MATNLICIDACDCGHSLSEHHKAFYGRYVHCERPDCQCELYHAKIPTRASIIRNAQGLIAEIDQDYLEIDSWNLYVRRPDEKPIERDPDDRIIKLRQSLVDSLASMGVIAIKPEAPTESIFN